MSTVMRKFLSSKGCKFASKKLLDLLIYEISELKNVKNLLEKA